jgi:LPS sulfotransferase NodH
MGKLNKLKSLGYFLLENLALEMGLINGHLNYQKFIVLGWARTGSNFLRSLLNAHSQIIAFSEIFRDFNTIDWGIPGYKIPSPKMLTLAQNDPIQFLQSEVFKEYPKHVAAVGFKIFYYHAQNEEWQPVWSYLQEHKDFRIIHLKRRNILKTYLSEMRAWKTGKWVNTNGQEQDNLSLPLDYEACLEKFETVRHKEEEFDRFFANHPKLEVFYEELSKNYAAEAKRLQQFLGVDYEPLAPATYKQRGQTLSQAIANYDDLKAKFAHTPWAEFFKD